MCFIFKGKKRQDLAETGGTAAMSPKSRGLQNGSHPWRRKQPEHSNTNDDGDYDKEQDSQEAYGRAGVLITHPQQPQVLNVKHYYGRLRIEGKAEFKILWSHLLSKIRQQSLWSHLQSMVPGNQVVMIFDWGSRKLTSVIPSSERVESPPDWIKQRGSMGDLGGVCCWGVGDGVSVCILFPGIQSET